MATLRYPLLVLNHHLQVISTNAAYYEKFQISSRDTVDNLLCRFGNAQWGIPRLRQHLETILKGDTDFDGNEVENDIENIAHRRILVSGRRVPKDVEGVPIALIQPVDITDQTYIGNRQ